MQDLAVLPVVWTRIGQIVISAHQLNLCVLVGFSVHLSEISLPVSQFLFPILCSTSRTSKTLQVLMQHLTMLPVLSTDVVHIVIGASKLNSEVGVKAAMYRNTAIQISLVAVDFMHSHEFSHTPWQ